MSDAAGQPADSTPRPNRLSWICMGSAAVFFLALQGAAWRIAGGFEYPLDDVYIHLAVAEQIASGGYGVNPGEVSSPASSPAYPLLLVPFAGSEAQRWLPLFWNVAGLLASAYFFGRILTQSGLSGSIAVALALWSPLALNITGLAAIGMEHSLHMAASLAIVSGLVAFYQDGRAPFYFWAGVLLAPAMRPEGLALALAASGALALTAPALALPALALALLVQSVFAVFLLGLGLNPVPSSVLTKLDVDPGSGLFGTLSANLAEPIGTLLAAAVTATLVAGIIASGQGRRDAGRVAFVVALAGAAHLCFGQIGWLNRYEPYALATVFGGLVFVTAAMAGPAQRVLALGATLVFAGALFFYSVSGMRVLISSPAAVRYQHGEMARLAKDVLQAPVAVNDLGYVAWRNPEYVLDLWGLASAEAREIRLGAPEPEWAAPLAREAGVEVAMIYEHWLASAVGSDWVRLGTLDLLIPLDRIAVGGRRVTLFAPDPGEAERLAGLVDRWAKDLPPRAVFTPATPDESQ